MASVARLAVGGDIGRMLGLSGGVIPANFLSVVYERDGEILAWACCAVESGHPVAHAVASDGISIFAMKRLVESMERFLWRLGLRYYLFRVHIRRKKWTKCVERLGIYERYATKSMHYWYKRNLAR